MSSKLYCNNFRSPSIKIKNLSLVFILFEIWETDILENNMYFKFWSLSSGSTAEIFFYFNYFITKCDKKLITKCVRLFTNSYYKMRHLLQIFLDNTKLKIVWIKITKFFKRRISIIL